MADWSCFSNHGHVLLLLARCPDSRLRDLAITVGITERAIHRLIDDLESAGALTRKRRGRRIHYSVDPSLPLRHPIQAHRTVGDLLSMIWGSDWQSQEGRKIESLEGPVSPDLTQDLLSKNNNTEVPPNANPRRRENNAS